MVEVFFFELYNLTMTSWPIIIFAIFDMEYLKRRIPEKGNDNYTKVNDEKKLDDKQLFFMEHPNLYKIGLRKECYSQKLLAQWIFCGIV